MNVVLRKEEDQNLTAAEIWDTLSAVNVNEHTEKKGKLTYLSWTWAWGLMMEHFPDLEIAWDEDKYFEGGSVMVGCSVTIGDVTRYMWLPVMDYKNSAIARPDSRAISDSRMRCMVKCFALFGLGHYIYAGEDLPSETTTPNVDAAADFIATIKATARTLKDSGIVVPDIMQAETNNAVESRNIDKLKDALSKLRSLENTE